MKRFAAIVVTVLFLYSLFGGQMIVTADEAQSSADPQSIQRLTIEEAGVYTLTGTMKGTVYVDPGAGDVTLILDNVEIQAEDEPAIMAVSGDHLTISVKEHTCNVLSDSRANTKDATIYTEVDTVFEGQGCLQINGNDVYGVLSNNASLTFCSRTVLIVSESSGIKAQGEQQGAISFNDGCTLICCKQGDMIDAADIRMNGGNVESTGQTRICDICGCCNGRNQCTAYCTQWVCMTCDFCSCCIPTTDKPGEIAEGITTNSAAALVPDQTNAVNIVMNDDSGNILLSKSGTYDISGKSENGSITVAKGTQGVVLILHDLDLTSQSGAALRIDSSAEVQIVVEGEVVLTDASAPAEETDVNVAAVIIEDSASVCITGDGDLNVVSDSANGILAGTDSSLVIDGELSLDITAAENGISSESDVAILDGHLTINAGDHAIHTDHILTVGEQDKCTGDPEINIESSSEGMEAAVINIENGNINITAEEEGLETESSDEEGPDELEASVNITGGDMTIQAGGHGIDSDGNINLINGSLTIDSEKSCVSYDDELYVSDEFDLNCDCEDTGTVLSSSCE